MDKNLNVDQYIIEGCGRCNLAKTLKCKALIWSKEIELLRGIALASGLKEEYKWSQPCYTYHNKNVFIVTAFKNYACIAFFKGSLLNDPNQKLITPGKNSQASKQLRFTSTHEIKKNEPIIKQFINEAIEVEKNELKVEFKASKSFVIPIELQTKFKEDPVYKNAFFRLTPGRQKSYLLHFNSAKKIKTKISRIAKCKTKILEGKGFNEY